MVENKYAPVENELGVSKGEVGKEIKPQLELLPRSIGIVQLPRYSQGFIEATRTLNIITIQNLTETSYSEVYRQPGCGKKTADAVQTWLRERGLDFKK